MSETPQVSREDRALVIVSLCLVPVILLVAVWAANEEGIRVSRTALFAGAFGLAAIAGVVSRSLPTVLHCAVVGATTFVALVAIDSFQGDEGLLESVVVTTVFAILAAGATLLIDSQIAHYSGNRRGTR